MLLSSPPRAREWDSFVTELVGWKQGTTQMKARMLIAEWLQIYEGDDVGPLDRQTPEVWARAFLEIGYFEADHTITEVSPDRFEESIDVHTGWLPGQTPDLYRTSTKHEARRFSWTEIAGDPQTASTGLSLWRTRSPLHVFGKITNRYRLLPDTNFWGFVGQDDSFRQLGRETDVSEWIVAPGDDVCEMHVFDLFPSSANMFLTEGSLRSEL